jgi:hypothetical protein
VPGESSIEIVDAAGPQIVRLDLDGAVQRRTPVSLPFSIDNAAFDGERWVIGGRDTAQRSVVARLDTRHNALTSSYLLSSHGDTLRGHFHLSSSTVPGRVRASWVDAPYSVAEIERGSVRPVRETLDAQLMRRLSDTTSRWIALPIVDTGLELLQTFTDLRSNHRLIVVSDTNGLALRIRAVESALGIASASAQRSVVAAVVMTHTPTVVLYPTGFLLAGR